MKQCDNFVLTVLLCVHRKREAFSLSLYLCSPQSSTLSLPNFVDYPLCFLTPYKMTSRPSFIAWASDSTNPDLYYSIILQYYECGRVVIQYTSILVAYNRFYIKAWVNFIFSFINILLAYLLLHCFKSESRPT